MRSSKERKKILNDKLEFNIINLFTPSIKILIFCGIMILSLIILDPLNADL